MRLTLADGLTLPVEAATETFLIVGKKGSGKSSTATRLAEQLVRAKVPIAVLDPVDVWWGLKAGAAGEREGGIEVYVFGGEHAELPLEPTAGTLMADTLVDHRINAVFVIRQFSNREKARFVSEFAEQLYKRNRDAMHLFCEEAHELMPQNPYGGEEEMLGRMIRIAKLGRTSGIGISAITQRPASLSKNYTTQAEILVAHRITGPQDRKAIDGWIEHHEQQALRQDVLTSLPTLKTGEAWFWAPDFPEEKPIGLRRVQVTLPETFDSRRTPKVGERRREPKSLAPVDLEKLGERMAATRKRAEENDPAKLRAELHRLRNEVQKADLAKLRVPAETKIVKERVLTTEDRDLLRRLVKTAEGKIVREAHEVAGRLEQFVVDARQIMAALNGASATAGGKSSSPGDVPAAVGAPVRAATSARPERVGQARGMSGVEPTARSRPPEAREPRVTDGLTSPQKRVLDVIAGLEDAGVPRTAETVAAWYGRHPRNKGLTNALGALRSAGLVVGHELTPDGRARSSPLPLDLRAVLAAVRGRERQILELVTEAYPNAVTRESLVEKLGLEHVRNKGFTNALGALHARGLLHYRSGGWVVASDFLFPQAIAS